MPLLSTVRSPVPLVKSSGEKLNWSHTAPLNCGLHLHALSTHSPLWLQSATLVQDPRGTFEPPSHPNTFGLPCRQDASPDQQRNAVLDGGAGSNTQVRHVSEAQQAAPHCAGVEAFEPFSPWHWIPSIG